MGEIRRKLVRTYNDPTRPAYYTWVAIYDVKYGDHVIRVEADGMQRNTAMKNARQAIKKIAGCK